MPDQQIIDTGTLRNWRTELPNIIDDLGLDPYERTLYAHYKKVCGANGGTCEEGIRKTAEKTSMSTAKVSLVRRELAKRGLITEHEQPKQDDQIKSQVFITIIDIWELNFFYYSYKEGRPSVKGWTIEQLQEWVNSVYHINASEQRLPDKRERLPDKRTEGAERLPGKQKKEPCPQKEPKNEPHGASAQAEPDALLSSTPSRRILKAKFTASVSASKGGKGPKTFPNLDVAKKFDQAAGRLNGQLETAIDAALNAGCNTIVRIVHYVAKWQPEWKQNGGPHATDKRNSARRDPGETFFDPYTGYTVRRDPATGQLVPVATEPMP